MTKIKYLIPNSITAMNLLFGIFAIIAVIDSGSDMDAIMQASWLIVIASLFDGLDGKVARLTNAQSRFGVEFDSIADLAAFVLAPAFISYKIISLAGASSLGVVAVIFYVITGAVRLARFNVLQGDEKKKGLFKGLPTPAGAGNLLAVILFMGHYYGGAIPLEKISSVLLVLLFLTGILMVSNVKYDNIMSMFFVKQRNLLLAGKYPLPFVVFLAYLTVLVITRNVAYFFLPFLIYYHLRAFFLIISEGLTAKKIKSESA